MMANGTTTDMPLSILLVEQDINWGRFLQSYLRKKGLTVDWATDGPDAWHRLQNGGHDFCILNPVLPSMDGCTLAAHVREQAGRMPLVFIAPPGQDSPAARIACFRAGADDVIVRPCSVEEILWRIRTIQKRFRFRPLDDSRIFDLGKLRFDHDQQRLYNGELSVRLTTKEAELLLALCLHRGRVLERDQALLAVWKSAEYYNTRSMDVYISKLRRLLFQHTYSEILNIHGVGFKLLTHHDAAFRQISRRDAGRLRRRRATGTPGEGADANSEEGGISETGAETKAVTAETATVETTPAPDIETIPAPVVETVPVADMPASELPASEPAAVPEGVAADDSDEPAKSAKPTVRKKRQ